MVSKAYTPRRDDDDSGQAGTPVRDVLDDAARDRLVGSVVGHLAAGVSAPVLERALAFWRKIARTWGIELPRASNADGLADHSMPAAVYWLTVAHAAGAGIDVKPEALPCFDQMDVQLLSLAAFGG